METLVLASNNINKVTEIGNLLSDYNIRVKGLKELGLGDPIEDGKNFAENAMIKAEYAFKEIGLPTIADDSGFCINSINNFPGLCSSRFADSVGSYPEAMRVLNDCVNIKDRTAYFTTVIAFVYREGNEIKKHIFEGRIDGEFTYPIRGTNGFGYCPCFTPKGYDITFAEMENEVRTKINHRAIALNKFLEFFKKNII